MKTVGSFFNKFANLSFLGKSVCVLSLALVCNQDALSYNNDYRAYGSTNANPIQRLQQLDRYCKAQDGASCYLLGKHFISLTLKNNANQDKYIPITLDYLERGCQYKDDNSCYLLGNAYNLFAALKLDGTKVTQDTQIAKEWLEKGCDIHNPTACASLGQLYDLGQYLPLDRNLALNYYDKSCTYAQAMSPQFKKMNPDDGRGCYNLGMAYIKGSNVKRNNLRGISYIKLACEIGYAQACKMTEEFQSIKD